MSHERPLVSVIINNFNYGRFLSAAVDSALAQTYPAIEVVAVDDGSADESRDVIRAYGDRLVSVLKENGGQASALNAGFRASSGSFVMFLDADDILAPAAVEKVVDAFRARPSASKVQFPLEAIDEQGRLLGTLVPARPLDEGDLAGRVWRHYEYSWPPTSGTAYPRAVLEELLPVPEAAYPICADMYLADLTPLLGPVISLRAALGGYRIHGENYHPVKSGDLELLRGFARRIAVGREHQARVARARGLFATEEPGEVLPDLQARTISLKVDRRGHPFPEDSLPDLVRRGIAAALRFPRKSVPRRILHATWFLLVAVSPRSAAQWLAAALFDRSRRGVLEPVLKKLRRSPSLPGARGAPVRGESAEQAVGG